MKVSSSKIDEGGNLANEFIQLLAKMDIHLSDELLIRFEKQLQDVLWGANNRGEEATSDFIKATLTYAKIVAEQKLQKLA